jgi:broad specificity phosphatase PhoE
MRGGWLLALAWLLAGTPAAADDEALWAALRGGGHVALLRHALAPGTGDPDHFRLDDCATQRNLSDPGREQARRIGRAFRERGVEVTHVLSSRWCRCLETARLLDLGPVEPLPALDSFFEHPERRAEQTAAVRRLLGKPSGDGTRVLVTHQVNITALTGSVPPSGGIVVIRPEANGQLTVLGLLESIE